MSTTDSIAGSPPKMGFLEKLSERINPILVKEVRQALRGNYFRWTFWLTVSGATVAAIGHIALAGADRGDGQQYFVLMFTCLAVAVLGLVPFFAFIAMGNEWDENTYDLLCLSNLKPRHIIAGKVYSSGVQTLLYFSAFGPFIVFAFLLQGVDLGVVGIILLGTFALSVILSTVAVMLSTLTTKRFGRMFFQAVIAAALMIIITAASSVAGEMVGSPQVIYEPNFALGVALLSSIVIWMAAYAFVQAIGRLAHPEENSSTPSRVIALVGVPVTVAGMTAMCPSVSPLFGSNRGSLAAVFFMFSGVLLLVVSIGFAGERDRLGRRVRTTIPRNRWVAFLMTPLLPGGARGLVFFLSTSLLLAGSLTSIRYFFGDPVSDLLDESTLGMLVAIAYGFTYLSLPRPLFRLGKPATPAARRLLIVAVFGMGILFPTLTTYFFGGSASHGLEHMGNPAWVLEEILDGRIPPGAVETILGFVVVGILISGRAIWRSYSEVLHFSALARERAQGARSGVSADTDATE